VAGEVGHLSALAEHRHDGRLVLEMVRPAVRRATMDGCGD
jgi:hypothetical protein